MWFFMKPNDYRQALHGVSRGGLKAGTDLGEGDLVGVECGEDADRAGPTHRGVRNALARVVHRHLRSGRGSIGTSRFVFERRRKEGRRGGGGGGAPGVVG